MSGSDGSAPAGVVIIGTGIAGITAAETIRSQGFAGPILVIGAEPGLPYRRTALSKDILGADLSADRILLRGTEFWADRDIEIRSDVTAVAINPEERTVLLDSGDEIGYRALLLATGARPRVISGLDAVTLRTHDEALALQSRLSEIADRSGAVVIVGAGLIGLELAASARAKGIDVTVVDTAERPVPRLPELIGDALAALHREAGVDLQLGTGIESASDDAGQAGGRSNRTVTLTNGETRAADLIVTAIGVQPNTELAENAGIAFSHIGIEVGECQRSSAVDVYAAGDVASVRDPFGGRGRAEHWLAAQDQGKAAGTAIAATLCGADHVPAPLVPHAWTIQFGVNVQFVGWPDAADAVHVDGDPHAGDAEIRYLRDGELVGAVAVGRPPVARGIKGQLAQRLADLGGQVTAAR